MNIFSNMYCFYGGATKLEFFFKLNLPLQFVNFFFKLFNCIIRNY